MVLAAAGSSDPEANATIAGLAARWQAKSGWFAVRPGYASAAAPSPRLPGPDSRCPPLTPIRLEDLA